MKFFTLLLTTVLCACGVKGVPQPPLEQPQIGRGEPVFSDATKDLNLNKKPPGKIEGDWEEPKDFNEETEQ